MRVGIVVPVFNEADRVGDFLRSLNKFKLDTFVVDDGSSDNTTQVVERFLRKNPHIFLLRHQINLGKGAALKTGCEAAFKMGSDAVVLIDGDGQHDADDIYRFIDVLKSGKYDIVFGSRNYSFDVPVIRFVGNKIAAVLISLLFGIYVSDSICGFRAFTKKIYRKVAWESQGYGIEIEMIIKSSKQKLKFKEIPVKALYHDKIKGVTLLDGLSIFFDILKWRISI